VTILQKITKMKEFRREKILTSTVFYSWLAQIKYQKKLKAFNEAKTIKMIFQMFHLWKIYVAITRNKQQVRV
jgi:hypothetical protein